MGHIMIVAKKFGMEYVCDKKIWKWILVCMFAAKNLELSYSMFVTKKFGNGSQYVCLRQKNLELSSNMFVTKKFGNGSQYVCLWQKKLEFSSNIFVTKKFGNGSQYVCGKKVKN